MRKLIAEILTCTRAVSSGSSINSPGRLDVESAWFQHHGQRKERLVHELELSAGLVRILDDRRAHGPRTQRSSDCEELRAAKRVVPGHDCRIRYCVTARRFSVPVYVPGVVVWPGEIELELEVDGPARLLVRAGDGLAEQR